MNTRYLTIASLHPDVTVWRLGAPRREPQVSMVLFRSRRPWIALSLFGRLFTINLGGDA